MNITNTALLTVLTFTVIQTSANAGNHYEFEIDPMTYALNGYSLHLRVIPQQLPNWRLGAGIYSMDFPNAIINLNDKNKDQGWEVNLKQGTGVFAEYFFNQNLKGWYTGLQLASQEYKLNNENSSLSNLYTTSLIMPYLGYRWSLNKSLYAQAWFGAGYTELTSGSTSINNREYNIDSTIVFGTMHIGYRF